MNNTNKLNRIVIKGYKSIKECDLELRNINVLIGSNGAGKSNFLSVFELLQNIATQNFTHYVAKKGVNALFYNGTKNTGVINIELHFIDSGEIKLKPYTLKMEMSDNNNVLLHESPPVFSERLDLSIGESLVSDAIQPYHRYEWRVYHFHDTSQYSKMKAEHNIINNKVFLYDAANLAAFLYRLKRQYRKSYERVIDTIQLVAPYFMDFELEPNEYNEELIVLRWRHKGCEDVFNASQLSDGTLRFICLAVLLLQPEQLQPETIVIDEPELGLHPYAITILSEMIKECSVSKQVILTTQSVELLEQFDVEDIIVVDRNENGSDFRRLDVDDLEVWLDGEYTLGELWNKNILGGRL